MQPITVEKKSEETRQVVCFVLATSLKPYSDVLVADEKRVELLKSIELRRNGDNK